MASKDAISKQKSRHRRKQKLVDYKGGGCIICGYDSCLKALDFHHVKKEEKSFSISVMIGGRQGGFAYNEEEAKKLANKHYGKDEELIRDPDVLDTWFSSGLWPFATLGWPDNKDYVEKFYPTSVLVTGFDIIFFWVARMIMFGTEFLNKEPFKDIYVHALVRDEKGQKMSKSKGSITFPFDFDIFCPFSSLTRA